MKMLRTAFAKPLMGAATLALVAACSSSPISGVLNRGGAPDTEEVAEDNSFDVDDGRISAFALEQSLEPDPRFYGQYISVPPAFANSTWAQPGGEADHVMHHLSGPESFSFAWDAGIGDGGSMRSPLVAPPVIAAGQVFTLDTKAQVSAFDVTSGKTAWTKTLTPDLSEDKRKFWQIGSIGRVDPTTVGFGGGVAYDNDRIFMATGFATAAALDPASGDVLWEANLPAPVRNPPTAVNGKVFAITISNQVVALDQDTGETLWSHESFEENARFLSTGSPAVDGDVVVVPFSSGEVVALDVETGRVLWTATVSRSSRMNALSNLNDIAGSPVIDRGAVFAVSHSGQVSAIDVRTGRVAWEAPISGLNMPWVAGDYLFLITVEGELLALSRDDGAVVWNQTLDSHENMKKKKKPITWSGPILVGDHLILTSSAGQMLQVSPQDGSTVNSYKLRAGTTIPPVVADSTVFVINQKGRLEAWR